MFLFPEPTTPKPTLTPRKYQIDAFEAVKVYLEYRTGNPCVVLPTGAGKTILIVLLCQWVCSWGGRVLILAHVKELLEQAADKINAMCPELHVGVYSAGLDRKEKTGQVTIAGIQSIYAKAAQFDAFDLVIVDECHLIPADGEGRYRSFLTDAEKINPNIRIVGLTATPYRTTTGPLCGPNQMLTAICYEIGVLNLIKDRFLCPLKSKHAADCDTSKLHIRAGEFVAEEVAALMSDAGVISAAIKTILARTEDRQSVLVFCSSVEHATKVVGALRESQDVFAESKEVVRLITGDTPSDERAFTLAEFKAGRVKYLVNVNVLTTGFDAPNVDCVALLRPTMSPGLYYQMCGRGFRLSDGKADCLILDFGGNIERHGPINAIRPTVRKGTTPPTKRCRECDEVVYSGVMVCPSCGYEWPIPEKTEQEAKHQPKHAARDIIGDPTEETESPVYSVKFAKHFKKGGTPDDPPTMKVEYITVQSVPGGLIANSWSRDNSTIREWVCIEHGGFAGSKARLWWSARSNDPFPRSVDRAIEIAEGGGLAEPSKIWTAPDPKNPKYTRIVRVELGPKPEAAELCECGGSGCVKCEFDFADVTTAVEPTDFGDIPF